MLCTHHLFAQKVTYYGEQAIRFDMNTRRYVVIATGKPCTGCEYKLFPGTTDTMQRTFYSNGLRDWDSTFSKSGRVLRAGSWYNHGLKNDSITSEYLIYFESGDTSNYYLQYVDRNGVKWQRMKAYSNFGEDDKKPYLYLENYYRFLRKEETKNFTDPVYKEAVRYDSAGYSETMASSGYETRYHESGAVMWRVKCAGYEYCLKHKGKFPTYPHSDHTGTWTFYAPEGWVSKEEIFDGNGVLIETRYYHQNGQPRSKMYYYKLFREIRIPSPRGLTVAATDSCRVKETKWYDNGVLELEDFMTSSGTWITCAYHRNGNPASFKAFTKDYEPVGVHKEWDEGGRVTELINYTDEPSDTISIKALNGKPVVINLRKRTLPREPLRPPGVYTHSIDAAHNRLVDLTVLYQTFFPNGQMKQEIHLLNGEREGTSRGWDSTGVLIMQVEYHLNAPHGEWKEWYPNGKVKKTFSYRNGLRNGKCTEYYETGKVKWKNTYSNGVPETPVAFDTLGNRIANAAYLYAFGNPECVHNVVKVFGESPLHYYFQDTSVQREVIIAPVVAEKYALRLALAFVATVPALDICSDWKNENNAPVTDLHRSRFAISSSLYTDSHKVVINGFFARHGIVTDSAVLAVEPVLGVQPEYFVYYSSSGLLDKMLIVDSLQFLLTKSNSIDVNRGYLLSIDAGHPPRPEFYKTHCASMKPGPGYTELEMRSKINVRSWYSSYRRVDVIVYSDLSYDIREPAIKWQYWPFYP